MRKLSELKLLTSLLVLLMVFFTLFPAVVEAKAGDEDEIVDSLAVSAAKEGDEDEKTAGDEDEATDGSAVSAAKAGDEDEKTDGATIHFQQGEGEEGGEGSLAGTGIALFIIALVLLLVAVIAVIGAASLGIIGLGYWQSESGD